MKLNARLSWWFVRSVLRVPEGGEIPPAGHVVMAILRPWWWLSRIAAATTLGIDVRTDTIVVHGKRISLGALEEIAECRVFCGRHPGAIVGIRGSGDRCPMCAPKGHENGHRRRLIVSWLWRATDRRWSMSARVGNIGAWTDILVVRNGRRVELWVDSQFLGARTGNAALDGTNKPDASGCHSGLCDLETLIDNEGAGKRRGR